MTFSPIEGQLDEIILGADSKACALFFASMKEPQRKALSPRAFQWASAIRGYIFRGKRQYVALDKALAQDIQFYESIASKSVVFPLPTSEAPFPVAQMALLATSAFPELKKAGSLAIPDPELAVMVLKDRKPAWIDKWCTLVLTTAAASHWLALHELEKLGICALQRNSDYWKSMLCTLSNTQNLYETVLLKDETVLSELWPMLEDPGVRSLLAEPELFARELFRKRWRSGGNIFAPTQSATRAGSAVLRATLVRAAADGLLNKDRLVDFSFVALTEAGEKTGKNSTYQHVSSADFAIKLNQELTGDNSASYASQYASLLGAAHKDIATYSSNVLTDMPEAVFSLPEICSCIQPVFLNKNKEPAESALRLLARLAGENPSAKQEYGPAILSALSHTSKEVIKKAIALIQSTSMLEEATLLDEYILRIEMLTGMERSSAAKLADRYRSNQSTATGTSQIDKKRASIEQLCQRASTLDEKLKELARIDEAIQAVRDNKRLDLPVKLDSYLFARLNPMAVLKPILKVDDLIYALTKVFSGKSSAMELELALDGVSRLCSERPENFQEKTAALREKVRHFLEEPGMFGWARSLAHLVLVWLGGSNVINSPQIAADQSSLYARRCLAISKRVAANRAAPLLATPTHEGGWIDSQVLVNRLVEYFWLKLEPDEVDFIQALLRIAPDHRDGALEAAQSIKGEVGEALRYALGGGRIKFNKMPEYWVAAFRAREPKGTSPELIKLLPKCGPDGAEAAVYGFDPEQISFFASDRYSSWTAGLPNFLPVKSSDPNFPGNQNKTVANYATHASHRSTYALFPTVLLHDNSNSFATVAGTYSWLHNRESLLALYAKRMLCNIHSIGSYWHGDFEILFDPDLSVAENGRYFICLAMSSKNNDLSRLAVDILIAAVGDCRIGANDYGAAMAAFLSSKIITNVRWVRGLRDTSKVSPLHAHFAWQSVGALICQISTVSVAHIPFLELLIELQLEHRYRTDDVLKQCLSGIANGGGKCATLAKAIIAYDGDEEDQLDAAMQDLELRIVRVERWQSWVVRSSCLAGDQV